MEENERKVFLQKIARLEQEKSALKRQLNSVDRIKRTVRRNFQDLAYLLTSVMSLSNRYMGGHVRRVAEVQRQFCEHLNLGNDTVYLYYYAALFHDIGLIGTGEEIVLKPESELKEPDITAFRRHPVTGEKIVGSMYNLKRVATIIRSHHEEYTGGGYPDGLHGEKIPLGARFLRVANDYDNLQYKSSMNRRQALLAIEDRSGILYDPKIAEPFCAFIRAGLSDDPEETRSVFVRDLKPGMILQEDVYLTSGIMLLPKGMLLTGELADKVVSFESLLDMMREVKVIG
ncbi:MAG: HD domain-containing protein [Spirochaetales bacterium]|nr:HD domain-containing protein [Spirochaetales bacterium]